MIFDDELSLTDHLKLNSSNLPSGFSKVVSDDFPLNSISLLYLSEMSIGSKKVDTI